MATSAIDRFREAYRESSDLRVEIWRCLNGMENCSTWDERRRSRKRLEAILGVEPDGEAALAPAQE